MEFGKALVLVLVCISHCVSGDEKLRRRGPEDRRIPGKYIVVLKNDVNVNSFTRSFETLRAPSEVKMIHKYEHALNGFAAHLSDGALNDLVESDHVDYIEEDSVSYVQSGTAEWGLDRVDERNLPIDHIPPNYVGHGEGSHIYVVDTGILRSHAEFSGRIGNGWDFEGGNANDCYGHGTHVAGTAAGSTYGVANKATIHPLRAYNCAGSGTNADLIQAMDWITVNKDSGGRNVASLSVGHGKSTAINTAAKNMYAAGIVVVVSAGNQGSDACNYSPGSLAEAITVGATGGNDARWQWSNYGSCVDMFAPGVDVRSAYINHNWDAASGCSNGCAYWSGTSMACPHVSGAAAILLGLDPSLSPAQVTAELLSDATPNKVTDAQGSPNKLLYIPSGTVRETRHGEVEPMPTEAYERGPGLWQAIMRGEDK